MKTIESKSNPYFKVLTKLLKSQGIKKENLFLVSGDKVIQEVLDDYSRMVESILVTEAHLEKISGEKEDSPDKKDSILKYFEKKMVLLTKALHKELDIFETHSPLLVCKLPEIPVWTEKEPEGLELFLPVQDPANLGAIVRSAVAFGVQKIILLKESANPYHPKAVRASSGMIFKVKFEEGPSLKELSNFSNINFVSLDSSGKNLENFEWNKNTALIVGEEGQGIPKELLTNAISIPISEKCESLNVMAATSIALYNYKSKK